MTELPQTTRDALLRVGTSTLTGILSRRGLRNMFLQDVWPIRPDGPRMVGPAFTMRFIPARENKTATGRGPVQQRAMEGMPAAGPCARRRCPWRPAGGLGWRHLLRPPEGARLRWDRDRWRAARHRGGLQDRSAGLSSPPVITAERDRPSTDRPQPADRLWRCGRLSGGTSLSATATGSS